MSATLYLPPEEMRRMVEANAHAEQTRLLETFAWLRRNDPVARVEIDGFDPFWAVDTVGSVVVIDAGWAVLPCPG